MSDLSKINFSGTEYNIKDVTARTEAAKKVTASGGDISNTKIVTADNITAEFPVPAANDTAKGFLGKMKKFCTDFNSFKTGIITLGKLVNNGQCTEAGFALDARYGKTLYDLFAQLNRDLSGFSVIKQSWINNNKEYGTTYRRGNSEIGKYVDDTYYVAVDQNGNVGSGTQLNGATNPTWDTFVKNSDLSVITFKGRLESADIQALFPQYRAKILRHFTNDVPTIGYCDLITCIWDTGTEATQFAIKNSIAPKIHMRHYTISGWTTWIEK